MRERIGELRHRVAIQSYGETPSGASDVTPAWTTEATVWAYIESLKGTTYFDTRQIGEGITHKVVIRFPSVTVTAQKWLLIDSRRFRIRYVKDLLERNRYLELLCEEERAA